MQCLSWEYMATPKCVMLFLMSTSKPCPQSPSEALFHVCLQSNWKNIFSIFFFKFTLHLPITKVSQHPVSMTVFPCMFVKLLHRQTSISLHCNKLLVLYSKATQNKFPVSLPGDGLLMQAAGRLLLLICSRQEFALRYFSEVVEHPHNLQYTFLQVEI